MEGPQYIPPPQPLTHSNAGAFDTSRAARVKTLNRKKSTSIFHQKIVPMKIFHTFAKVFHWK
jgi:hypothetical protein